METNKNAVDTAEREELDIETFAKENPDHPKPGAGVYIIRIDRERNVCMSRSSLVSRFSR